MFCPKCGAKIEDDALFCEECGAKLEGLESSNSDMNFSEKSMITQNDVFQSIKGKIKETTDSLLRIVKNKKWWFIGVGSSILIICFFICVATLSKPSDSQDSSAFLDEESIIDDTDDSDTYVIEHTTKKEYPIKKVMSAFSEDRAWVSYNIDKEQYYAVINTEGVVVWSISRRDFGMSESGYDFPLTTCFEDGVSCISNSIRENGNDHTQMIILNAQGNILFDSRKEAEGTYYYFIGYGENAFSAFKNVANFSSNKWFVCDFDKNGKQIFEEEYRDEVEASYFEGGFAYYDENIFCTFDKVSLNYSDTFVFNRTTHKIFRTYKQRGSSTRGLMLSGGFKNGMTIGHYYRNPYYGSDSFLIKKTTLQDAESWSNYDYEEEILEIDELSCFLYGCSINDDGIYDSNKNLISKFPEDWNIEYHGKFSGDYAVLVLSGADNYKYIVAIDKNGKAQYTPINIGDRYFKGETYHGYVMVEINGENVIFSPKGEKTTIDEINKITNTYKIGDIEMINGYQEITDKMNYGYIGFKSIDNRTIRNVTVYDNADNSSYSSSSSPTNERKYINKNNFSIIGKWKNTGSYTLGQVQKNAIISFDGTHCNVYSPQDTYTFYKNGNDYKLDCTTYLFSETLSLTVKIIDDNHIDVYNGSNYLELTRTE